MAGAVAVGELGLAGDTQCDTKHHGGPEQAVYAYAGEDVERWAAEPGRDLPAGVFGENLRLQGVDVSGAVVGETWRIADDEGGGCVLQVTSARQPCRTFAAWMEEPRWVRRFTAVGALGAYLRVLETGSVVAGARVEVLDRPDHGVTVADTFPHLALEHAAALLDAEQSGSPRLHPDLRRAARRAVTRATAGS
ncbi:hypothetical protein GCM10025868_08970 [Angustibacter aerolatus]|uniref:MOSC domain-containing protein n=1 Tax=Angustibacter aerolatus TaxID=1162965 RepID=A0ABQ6JBV8_9ACTN|nr:MOSC domain-containing protein [Angustibacter aerolatus]GMA85647.1 hypothetical protein GCM10025868_08970 [Angustibacter aerolatus]